LSPLGDVRVEDTRRLCGIDLARLRGVAPDDRFHYHASLRVEGAAAERSVPVVPGKSAEVCVDLPHVTADGGSPDDAPGRYVIVRLTNGVAGGGRSPRTSTISARRAASSSPGSSDWTRNARRAHPRVATTPSISGRFGTPSGVVKRRPSPSTSPPITRHPLAYGYSRIVVIVNPALSIAVS